MKKYIVICCLLIIGSLLTLPELDARGGRGGGRGGRSVNRSPSMSRTSHSRPKTKPQTRPKTKPQKKTGERTPTRKNVQQFLQNRPSTPSSERPGRRPGDRPSQRPGEGPITRPESLLREKPSQAVINRATTGQNIRNNIHTDRPNRGNWFNNNFWNKHNFRPPYYGQNRNWWRWATSVGVGSWLGWQSLPIYYGDDGYYWGTDNDLDYSQQLEMIESSTAADTSDEWMPLGVYALSKDEDTVATPNIYLQLALSKNGLISGTYYNVSTDETFEAEGLVDEKSQVAAWKIAENENSPIMETGIYNLTQWESPIQVHFSNGETQEMMLIRLDEPEE